MSKEKTPLPTRSCQQHRRTIPSLITQRTHPSPTLRETIIDPVPVDIRRKCNTRTSIIGTAIRQTPFQRLGNRAGQIRASDTMVAPYLIRLRIRVRERLVVVARTQLHRIQGIARGDVQRLSGTQSGYGAVGEFREDAVRVAVDGQGIGLIASAAGVSDARDVTQDVAELEAFFPRVGVHSFGVGAENVHAAADLPGLAEEVGVDGAVLGGAADGLADARRREGVAGGSVLGGAGGDDSRLRSTRAGDDDSRLGSAGAGSAT